jgi:hypothetical protein
MHDAETQTIGEAPCPGGGARRGSAGAVGRGRLLRQLVLLATLVRLVMLLVAVQSARVPAVALVLLGTCQAEGGCDDCDDTADCHCPPGCSKCPCPSSHTSSRPPLPPPRVIVTPAALLGEPSAQRRPDDADGPPADAERGSVWRPPRAAC